jgi:hypothetical protein
MEGRDEVMCREEEDGRTDGRISSLSHEYEGLKNLRTTTEDKLFILPPTAEGESK